MAYNSTRKKLLLRCTSQGKCQYATKSIPSDQVETELIANHLLGKMGALAAHLTQPAAEPPPEVAEWKRELRYREATPDEYLLPHDRERIVELQGLIASAVPMQSVHSDADYARIYLMLSDVTLGAGSWFSREEADRNRDLRLLIASVAYDVAMRRIQNVRFRAAPAMAN